MIPGWLGNGTQVDVYHRKVGSPALDRPEAATDRYETYRWRKYLGRISRDRYKNYRAGYARFLCRSWNQGREGDARLKSFFIYYYQERTLPDYGGNEVTQRQLVSWKCYQ